MEKEKIIEEFNENTKNGAFSVSGNYVWYENAAYDFNKENKVEETQNLGLLYPEMLY